MKLYRVTVHSVADDARVYEVGAVSAADACRHAQIVHERRGLTCYAMEAEAVAR